MKIYFQFFFCLVFAIQLSFSQNNSASKNSDSINAKVFEKYTSDLKVLQVLRSSDSLKQTELQEQLKKLKTTDNLKKIELQNQLNKLKQKDSLRLATKKKRIDSLRATAKSYPIRGFFNDTLFVIYAKLGSFSVKDRSEAITSRIKKLPEIFSFKKESIKIVESESTVDLNFEETIIVSISENDAVWNNTSKTKLAEKYKIIIEDAVLKYKEETSYLKLGKEILLALLVLVIIIVIIRYLKKGFQWIATKIESQEGKAIKGITIKNYTLYDAKSQIRVLLMLNNALKWITILFSVYIALPILFGIFPWTEHFTYTLLEYVTSPAKKIALGIWNYLPNLITIIVIVVVFNYLLKAIRFFKTEIENEKLHLTGFYPDWANPTFQIIKVIIYAFMGIVIFPFLPGSDSPIFQGVSVFLGVLFTFGSSGSLSNVVAGLVLTYMRLFKIGDRVKIGEVIGDVIEKSMLVTRIKTIKNEIISIPNSTVMSGHTINYSSETNANGLILHTTVTIGYDVPWKKMHQALIDAAKRTDLIEDNPEPFVLQTSLDDFYVSYQINAYTKDANKQALIYSQLHANIQDCCNENGIEILSPHYRSGRDGNSTTIPENYLDKNYTAPKFNVSISKDESNE